MIRSRFTLGLVLKQRQMHSPFSFPGPLFHFAPVNEKGKNFHLFHKASNYAHFAFNFKCYKLSN